MYIYIYLYVYIYIYIYVEAASIEYDFIAGCKDANLGSELGVPGHWTEKFDACAHKAVAFAPIAV